MSALPPLPTTPEREVTVLQLPIALRASLCRLSPEWLVEHRGEQCVRVEHTDRAIYHPAPSLNGGKYPRIECTLREALALLAAPPAGVWHYLSSLSIDLDVLAVDLGWPPLKAWRATPFYDARLFVGSIGTGSSPHFDITDNILVMLWGTKRVRLYSPWSLPHIRRYPARTRLPNYAADEHALQALETARYPVMQVELDAGQALFIPSGWWHEVENQNLNGALSLLWKPRSIQYWRCRNCRHVALSTLLTGRYL